MTEVRGHWSKLRALNSDRVSGDATWYIFKGHNEKAALSRLQRLGLESGVVSAGYLRFRKRVSGTTKKRTWILGGSEFPLKVGGGLR